MSAQRSVSSPTLTVPSTAVVTYLFVVADQPTVLSRHAPYVWKACRRFERSLRCTVSAEQVRASRVNAASPRQFRPTIYHDSVLDRAPSSAATWNASGCCSHVLLRRSYSREVGLPTRRARLETCRRYHLCDCPSADAWSSELKMGAA